MNIFIAIASILLGYLIGYHNKEIKLRIDKIIKKQEEQRPEVGATAGSYYKANENAPLNNNKKVGAVLPKEPSLIEWEEQQRVQKMQEQRTKR